MGRQLTMPALSVPLPRKWRSRRTLKRVLVISASFLLLHPLFSFLQPAAAPDALHASHPIAQRVAIATKRWKEKVESQSQTWEDFKSEYVKRYQLDPPDGMDQWFRVVKEDGHVLVDEYDEMMRSLEPFRMMGGAEVLRRTLEVAQMPTFSLLNITSRHSYFSGTDYRGSGKAYDRENYGPGLERVEGLASMMQRHINYIPDGTVLAVSELAEPRVIVPWQDHPTTLASFASLLSPSSSTSKPDQFARLFSSLKQPNASELLPTSNFRGEGSSWELYARSCPPESPARKKVLSLKGDSAAPTHSKSPSATALNEPSVKRRWPAVAGSEDPEDRAPVLKARGVSDPAAQAALKATAASGSLAKSYKTAEQVYESKAFEFVENGWKGLSHSALCDDAELHQVQGAFYSDWRGLPALYPVFSPSKIDGFSDILIPSNFYYGDDERYSVDSADSVPWSEKVGRLFWRGATTGGGNSPPRHQLSYQRHRFVRLAQSLSSAFQSLLVAGPKTPEGHEVLTHTKRSIGDLNEAWLDVGFTSYTGCGDPDICEITERFFPLKDKIPLKDMSKYKGILDLDGMAFSGRFVALMGMGSGVFKSTIYRDFASEWIEPWLHYVPVSGGYEELYNLLAYFLPLPADREEANPSATSALLKRFKGRTEAVDGDAALKKIADAAIQWSDLVANKPDIEAYVYRLALEWARILQTPEENVVYRIPDEED